MSDYSPCSSCKRHVKDDVCPFCAATPTRAEAVPTIGRMSRAMVFASATLAAAACGGSQKPATTPTEETHEPTEREIRHRPPCAYPSEQEIAAAQKKVDEAKTEEERRGAENELQRIRMPVCAPYGAPPARRRVV